MGRTYQSSFSPSSFTCFIYQKYNITYLLQFFILHYTIFSRQEHFFISASNIKNAAEWIFVSVLRRFWYWKMKLVG